MTYESSKKRSVTGWALRNLFPLLILVAAGAGAMTLIRTPPTVQKSAHAAPTPVVGVADVQPLDTEVHLEAFGTVVAARQVRIIPEVTGRVVDLHPQLVPGGLVRSGDRLVKLDPAEYEIRVTQATAQRDVAALAIEQQRSALEALKMDVERVEAELTYLRWNVSRLSRLSEQGTAGEVEARDARSRHEAQEAALRALRARVTEQEKTVAGSSASLAAANSDLDAARLDLERTEVIAPFDAIVIDEFVDSGQRVGPQSTVATLVATETFWIEAAVPMSRLSRIQFAENGAESGEPNVRVALADVVAGDDTVVREGHVLRLLGDLDRTGRMARVLVAVRDPLGLESSGNRLLIGSYVRLEIAAGRLEDVYAVPRRALRENDRVWVRDDEGKLGIREVDILWRRDADVLVRDGFVPGDLLVTTHLTNVIPGMPLAIRSTENPSSESDTPGAENDLAKNP